MAGSGFVTEALSVRVRVSPEASLRRCAVCGLTALLLLAGAAHAVEPLYGKNLTPVSGLLGLPSMRSAALVPARDMSLAVHGALASHAVFDGAAAGEALRLDGETHRLALEWRYGLAPGWELQVELPWLSHSGGSLDALIDSWHSLWGMPDGGREAVPRDQLDFRYLNSTAAIALQDSVSGVGDVTLGLHRALRTEGNWRLSAGLGYKLATGEERELLGSGAEDIFLVLRANGLPPQSAWQLFGQAGYLRAGQIAGLQAAQERNLWFAGLGVSWTAHERVTLLAQVDAHAAPLQSNLTALGSSALMLNVGARWQLTDRWALEAGFMEDIRVETAPDITFQASLRFTP
tara:strand:- start:2570 stop:3610 length:1041 start_codon:yes stop_codon:yes gene_type:complete